MVALGTRSRDEDKREKFTPEWSQVEISLWLGTLMNSMCLSGLTVVGMLFLEEGLSSGRII